MWLCWAQYYFAAVYEAADLFPKFRRNTKALNLAEGITDLGSGKFSVSYPLGSKGEKEILFKDEQINVRGRHKGKFTEILPLLESSESKWSFTNDQIIQTSQKK